MCWSFRDHNNFNFLIEKQSRDYSNSLPTMMTLIFHAVGFKNPRQLKLSIWKKASESWRPTRLASSEAEAEELTGMLVAYACWMAETES